MRLAEAVPARERDGRHEEIEADRAGELVHVRGGAHLQEYHGAKRKNGMQMLYHLESTSSKYLDWH